MFQSHPIGVVINNPNTTAIKIEPDYHLGLRGLDQFSHIHVLWWFDRNDESALRRTLQVYPCKNPRNPLTGVFATHSPKRPNLIGLTLCRIKRIEGLLIHVEAIDALDQTPVLDIKCHIPYDIPSGQIRFPKWARD